MSSILMAEHVSKTYRAGKEDFSALSDISLCIDKGESVAIIGKSGSGKSTLMHILAMLDTPTSGELKIDGSPTAKLKGRNLESLRNKNFGFVFQQFFLNARSGCLDNVTLPLVVAGVSSKERNARGVKMLELVGLKDKAKQKANDLSGGQKQRLCIARALINDPEVIFADEPTGNLDSENGKLIIDLLFRLHKEHTITLVIVTHDEDLAKLCDRKIMIKDGKIVEGVS